MAKANAKKQRPAQRGDDGGDHVEVSGAHGTADHDGDGDHGHGEEALGSINVAAWLAGATGIVLGLAVFAVLLMTANAITTG
jgi:hypothetical protein